MSGGFDPALLAVLVCPVTRTPLRHEPAAGLLISDAAGLAYPIVAGVPVLLVEAARPLPPRSDPA
ncbi:Trm112 family protein [Sphingomonas morindae]|uniref:UPF0434 protein LHA26_07625 n=1 Tax=Sphingomonas morindae TaxID=1541170 RepID=A0ABY4XBQ1_9SPHN|nr:Trm112 family protein [Sphingomonas morindae]USI74309.1 Trm112 family protein [Sphingomonas morindae]